jgi:hypothetical protein
MVLSGPMFESSGEMFRAQSCVYCRAQHAGAHYNHYQIQGGIAALKCIFPDGQADEMNFALFSTSGVHGSYITIEQIEASLQKYQAERPEGNDWPDDYYGDTLTVLIVQPRICCLRYGNVTVTLEDIPYLKRLRESSWLAVAGIGKRGN